MNRIFLQTLSRLAPLLVIVSSATLSGSAQTLSRLVRRRLNRVSRAVNSGIVLVN
jgi:hypothetical protein